MDMARGSMRLVLDARTAAFAALIDFAGVFPPASMALVDAVDAYRRLRSGDQSWVAGRFLCRASQLTELAAIATASFTKGERPWEIGVVFDLPVGASAAASVDFQSEMEPAMTIGAVESKPPTTNVDSVTSMLDAMLTVAPDVVPFVEIDRQDAIEDQVEHIAVALTDRNRVGGAKLRCGGLDASDFPSPAEVATFILAATNHRLPFKATAGLHQPVRHFDAELDVHRHGFVNLAMATAVARQGADAQTIERVVDETDPAAFSISAALASWRDQRIPGSSIRQMRTNGFVAYGSCDFVEPIEALKQLDMIGGGT